MTGPTRADRTPGGAANAAGDAGLIDADACRQIGWERLGLLFRLTPQPVLAGAAFSCLIFLVLRPTAPAVVLAGWLVARLVISFVRVVDSRRFVVGNPASAEVRRHRIRFFALLVIDAATWAAAGLLFVGEVRPPLGLALLASLAVVAAVSLYSLASDALAGIAFFSVILLPNAARQFLMGTPDTFIGGCSFLVLEVLLVTECRGIEQRLVEMLRLRHENAAIAEQRRQALELSEHANRAKSRFLAIVSHQMRTPLHGILGTAQLLQRSPSLPAQAPWLASIRQSGQDLLHVIDDLLDQSRIESRRIVITPGRLRASDLVAEATAQGRRLAGEAGLAFASECTDDLPEWIVGDALRIRQVLFNLLGNAFKFTREGRVGLRVERRGKFLHFSVIDTGIGIAAESVERIFQAFEQVAAPGDTEFGAGTGLGLSISRELARAMGGDLVCHSVPGEGSTFEFSLPLVHVEAPASALAAASSSAPSSTASSASVSPTGVPAPVAPTLPALPAQRGRVLVAEDHPTNAVIAQAVLERAGLEVVVADDGAAALALMHAHRFSAVLMDCQMPVLDGFEATRQWRLHEREAGLPRLPIIALTAHAVDGNRARCLEAGMDDFLSKPFDLEALVTMLEKHLAAGERSAGSAAGLGPGSAPAGA